MAWCIFVKITELKCTSRLSHSFVLLPNFYKVPGQWLNLHPSKTLTFTKNYLIVCIYYNLSVSLSFSLSNPLFCSISLTVHLSNLNLLQDFTNYKKLSSLFNLDIDTHILIHSFGYSFSEHRACVKTCRK